MGGLSGLGALQGALRTVGAHGAHRLQSEVGPQLEITGGGPATSDQNWRSELEARRRALQMGKAPPCTGDKLGVFGEQKGCVGRREALS